MTLPSDAFSSSTIQKSDPILKGTLNNGFLKSSNTDFIVTVDVGFINISYLNDYITNDCITIEITNETGQVVYYNPTDPVAGKNLMINCSDWEEGCYSISITDNSGGCISGNFYISH